LPITNTVDITTYGAIGNGLVDDTAAVNAAFAKAKSSGMPVSVPAGDYLLASTVTVPDGVTIIGTGNASWLQGAVIFGSNDVFQNLSIGAAGVRLEHVNGANNTTFTGCTFIGGGGAGNVNVITLGGPCGSLSNVQFANCSIQCNFGTSEAAGASALNDVGISTQGSATITNLTFTGCDFGTFNGTRTGSPCMDVVVNERGGVIQGLQFNGCTFEYSDETCLDIESPALATPIPGQFIIKNNLIKGAGVAGSLWAQGLCLEVGQSAVVTGNTIYGGKYGALEIWSGGQPSEQSLAVISGNTIDATQGYVPVTNAVHINASQATFTNNTLRYPAGSCGGVSLDGVTGCIVTGDSFVQTTPGGSAVSQVNGASGNTISGNTTTP
jgi:hypothetical protein